MRIAVDRRVGMIRHDYGKGEGPCLSSAEIMHRAHGWRFAVNIEASGQHMRGIDV